MVMHVAASLSAGVASGVESCIDHTNGRFDHVVYGHRDLAYQVDDALGEMARVVDLPANSLRQAAAVRRAIRRERPDVLHLHSTRASWMVRMLPARLPPAVLTPHCYAFERSDGRVVRALVRSGEQLLVRRVDVVAACSEREAMLARTMTGASVVEVVPNVPSRHVRTEIVAVQEQRREVPSRCAGPLRVATVGRITRQKDPQFLLDIVAAVAERGAADRVEFIWIGGGDRRIERSLRSAGVDVIGWQPRHTSLGRLADSDLYLHTAAWEGMPLALLEALELGVPVVARSLAALDELGLPETGHDSDDLADRLVDLADDEQRRSDLASSGHLIAGDRIGTEAFGDRVSDVYHAAMARQRRR